jgi:hypothetical protein
VLDPRDDHVNAFVNLYEWGDLQGDPRVWDGEVLRRDEDFSAAVAEMG